MNVWIERAPRPDAPLESALVPRLHRVIVDERGCIRAVRSLSNPLDSGWTPPVTDPPVDLVVYSGTLAADLQTAYPGNWLAPGRAALDRWIDATLPLLRPGQRLLVLPHRRHILSDAPSAAVWLDTRPGAPLGLAVAPAALIERTMLETLDDHLERTFERLGAATRLVMLGDLRPSPDGVEHVPLGEGVLPQALVQRLIARHLAPGTPVVLDEEHAPATGVSPWANAT